MNCLPLVKPPPAGRLVEICRFTAYNTDNMYNSSLFMVIVSLLGVVSSDSGYSKGKQFVVAFMYNYGQGSKGETANYLFISSERSGTVYVEMAQIEHVPAFRHRQSLTPGKSVMVALPQASEMPGSSTLEKRGVHVYSDVDISVYAMNDDLSLTSADAAVVLPVTALATKYVIPSPSINPVILVAGLIPGTQVTVHLRSTCTVNYKGHRYANSTINEVLGNQDVLQLMPGLSTKGPSNCDMAGSIVTATHPIGVFTGSACIYKGKTDGCGHEMQQVIPDELLGTRFIVPDLMDNRPYNVRIVSPSSTFVSINEHHRDLTVHSYQVEMDRGDFRQYTIPDGTILEIFSHTGIHVSQYDGTTAPFSNPIPAIDTYGWNYTVSTMNNPTSRNFINYVNVVVHKDSASTLTIDGKTVDQTKWRRVTDLGYSVGTFPVTAGSHRIEADDTFMVQVYGYDGVASYAFQGGYYFKNLPSAHLGVTDYPPAVVPTSPSPSGSATPATCSDSPGVNCQVLDATIGVCSNPDSASHMCMKTCHMCGGCLSSGSCVVG